ncbi:PTS sugar transporter subunit IIA [Paenibacillus phoenicis]|jgi:PTS system galactitol-specific IIA component|uniref:PTS sugar transporter subunit IIA n=1 Tax=Paenibacillus phoenicis TaxID=554117 RepID=A0ABU5PPX5_9BACL|nr:MULTISPECIES: PTS sugar transporter subunit IIA [Paenibacillus]EES73143.1 phosphoenolpyruvate-dependent sugar phosphotransferase system, EIIA 2 [Paenibacillus sp. oral taxon 786 str. D14]MCT2196139.1 PTS sugar transporter subunit IIA [Paenibacillus sp. p3-SID1389]MEA3572013.1 PTS sugar transporter subunit IIA [Paenibacillus phoenicis]
MSTEWLEESFILLGLEGDSKEEVLSEMAGNLLAHGVVKESYIRAIIEREQTFPTGLPTVSCSVAIPHTDIEHVNRKAISIGILKRPVEFGIMGEESATTPVEIVFMLAMDQKKSQLRLLTRLMQIIQDGRMLDALRHGESAAAVKALMNDKLQPEEIKEVESYD